MTASGRRNINSPDLKMNDFAKPGLGQTELPPVNSDDNGKVLGVNNGAWDKVDAPSGGGDEFVITFASATDGATSDVTQDEIYEAASSGKQMVLMVAGVREPVLKYAFGSGGPAKWCEKISSESFKTSQANKGSSSKVTLSSRPSGAFIVNDVSGTLNKTYSEIYTAFRTNGQPVLIYRGTYPNEYFVSVVACYYEYGTGNAVVTNGVAPIAETYIAATQNDYPVAQS